MTDGFVYGKAVLATITNIEGREPPISELARARGFWLVCRYTSLIYIERQHLILSGFIDGFRGEAMRTANPYSQRWFARVLAEFYRYKGLYETGIDLLRQGNQGGYRSIAQAAKFSEYLLSRSVNDNHYYREVTDRTPPGGPQPVGLVAWGRRAYEMGRNTLMSLRAEWTYERFQEPFFVEPETAFPASLPAAPLPAAGAPLLAAGDSVPCSGVWLPIDRRFGCPNYLVATWQAPQAMSTVATAWYKLGGPEPDPVYYVYERRPSRWELVWEDRRYQGPGPLPEERGFLSAEIELPNEPLHLIQPPP